MIRRLFRGQRGQALTEFALAAPLLLLLVFGIMDLGRYFFSHMQLQLAAQETVRLGGLGRSDAAIAAFASDYLHLTEENGLRVTVTPGDAYRDSGNYVTVTIERPFSFLTPLPDAVVSGISALTATSTIRVE